MLHTTDYPGGDVPDISLFITYFISTEEDLPAAHRRYIERVNTVREITDVLFVSDYIKYETIPNQRENMLADLRRDMAIDNTPFDESKWDLYSLSCVAVDVDEPAAPGAAVSRLWRDLQLAEEDIPREFTSSVDQIPMSPRGDRGAIGKLI